MIIDSCQLFGSLTAVGKKELFYLEVLQFILLYFCTHEPVDAPVLKLWIGFMKPLSCNFLSGYKRHKSLVMFTLLLLRSRATLARLSTVTLAQRCLQANHKVETLSDNASDEFCSFPVKSEIKRFEEVWILWGGQKAGQKLGRFLALWCGN